MISRILGMESAGTATILEKVKYEQMLLTMKREGFTVEQGRKEVIRGELDIRNAILLQNTLALSGNERKLAVENMSFKTLQGQMRVSRMLGFTGKEINHQKEKAMQTSLTTLTIDEAGIKTIDSKLNALAMQVSMEKMRIAATEETLMLETMLIEAIKAETGATSMQAGVKSSLAAIDILSNELTQDRIELALRSISLDKMITDDAYKLAAARLHATLVESQGNVVSENRLRLMQQEMMKNMALQAGLMVTAHLMGGILDIMGFKQTQEEKAQGRMAAMAAGMAVMTYQMLAYQKATIGAAQANKAFWLSLGWGAVIGAAAYLLGSYLIPEMESFEEVAYGVALSAEDVRNAMEEFADVSFDDQRESIGEMKAELKELNKNIKDADEAAAAIMQERIDYLIKQIDLEERVLAIRTAQNIQSADMTDENKKLLVNLANVDNKLDRFESKTWRTEKGRERVEGRIDEILREAMAAGMIEEKGEEWFALPAEQQIADLGITEAWEEYFRTVDESGKATLTGLNAYLDSVGYYAQDAGVGIEEGITEPLKESLDLITEFGSAREELFFGGRAGNLTGALYKQVITQGVGTLYNHQEILVSNKFFGFFNPQEAAELIGDSIEAYISGGKGAVLEVVS